jgi:hypothetical protein
MRKKGSAVVSNTWPPQQPGQAQPNDPYDPYDPYGPSQGSGQYDPPSQYWQGGQYDQYDQYDGEYGPPSQGYGPPQPWQQSHPSSPAYPPQPPYPTYPTYPTYPPGMAGPPSQYPGQSPPGPGQFAPPYPTEWSAGPWYGAPPSYGVPPVPEQPRRWVDRLLVALIVLVLFAAGGAAFTLAHGGGFHAASGTPTAPIIAPTATATPAIPPSGFTFYADPRGYFRFAVPSDWTTQTQQSGESVGVTNGPIGAIFAVVFEPFAIKTQTDDLNAAFTSVLTGSDGSTIVGTFAHRQGPTTITLSGNPGKPESADFTIQGYTFHGVVLVADHHGGRVIIGYLALANVFANANSEYFQPMLTSFTFLK